MGGLATTYLALELVAQKLSGGDIWNALAYVKENAAITSTWSQQRTDDDA